jgi:hypothetical protein
MPSSYSVSVSSTIYWYHKPLLCVENSSYVCRPTCLGYILSLTIAILSGRLETRTIENQLQKIKGAIHHMICKNNEKDQHVLFVYWEQARQVAGAYDVNDQYWCTVE